MKTFNERCGCYLFEMLKQDKTRRTSIGSQAPDFPAIWGYDPEQDAPLWVEVKAALHVIDYCSGFPDRVNHAAFLMVGEYIIGCIEKQREKLAKEVQANAATCSDRGTIAAD